MTPRRIIIEPISLGERGQLYRVTHNGAVLIERSRSPELDACRALLARGISGKLQVWRPGKTAHDMQLDIERAAGWTVLENEREGPRLVRWRPYALDAVLSRAVSPPAAADKIAALELV
jgi:hypothetical protein